MHKLITCLLVFGVSLIGKAQQLPLRTITTSVPMLQIHGDGAQNMLAGVDVVNAERQRVSTAFYGNPALLNMGSSYVDASTQHMPWLRSFVPDISLTTFSMAAGLGKRHAVGMNARFFTLGSIQIILPDSTQENFRPMDISTQLNYAFQLTPYMSMGVAMKYIYSDLGLATTGQAIVGDIGVTYQRSTVVENKIVEYSVGGSIMNLGQKMTYSSGFDNFLPATLKLGGQIGLGLPIDPVDVRFDLLYQTQKLLVPTPPVYQIDPATGQFVFDENGNPIISAGNDPNVGSLQGAIQSFYDAPDGIPEEMTEFSHQFGAAIAATVLDDFTLTLRNGIYYEFMNKGGRQYYSSGIELTIFGLRAGGGLYLVPPDTPLISFNTPLNRTFFISFGYQYVFDAG